MNFTELNIIEPILKAIKDLNYSQPTDIQKGSIPFILNNRDLLGCARTGTGKTAAFAIPVIQSLHNSYQDKEAKNIKALVLTPTRELAIQIKENFDHYSKYTKLKTTVILGGVKEQPQISALKKGVDIVIATPGRLLDLIKQNYVHLGHLQHLVLDEADSMLDMGFIHDVKRIITYTPKQKQTLLFSATMPMEIKKLATELLKNPIEVISNPVSSAATTINQTVYFIDKNNKTNLLLDLLNTLSYESVLIFSRTKHGANKLVTQLQNKGIGCAAIHGNKSQAARNAALNNFKSGKIKVLVATDIAARGIDISGITHVINYEFPDMAETYVHRIGRTGRAGREGNSISFCSIDEKACLYQIEKITKNAIPVIYEHDYPMINLVPEKKKTPVQKSSSKSAIKKSSENSTNNTKPSVEKKRDSYKKDFNSNRNNKSNTRSNGGRQEHNNNRRNSNDRRTSGGRRNNRSSR